MIRGIGDIAYVLRFESYLELRGRCLIWTRALSSAGYGVTSYSHQTQLAHRTAFAIANRRQPNGLILHSPTECTSAACCNPLHLREGSDWDNAQDRKTAGVYDLCRNGHVRSNDNIQLVFRSNGDIDRLCRQCKQDRRKRHGKKSQQR